MSWYYVEAGQQKGSVGEEELVRLVSVGALEPSSLVWQQGMEAWKPLSESAPQVLEQAKLQMAVIGETAVTAGEKDLVVQKMREGVEVALDEFRYGGYWLRVVAHIIDVAVLFALNMVVSIVFTMGAVAASAASGSATLALIGNLIALVLQLGIGFGYPTWMVGKYGATLGKMAVGLKVVKPSGGRVSYLLAFGRSLARDYIPAFIAMVAALIFGALFLSIVGFDLEGDAFSNLSRGQLVALWTIGVFGGLITFAAWMYCYAMAGWDKEKRALHDHICSTRVVFK
jgi:uncharacterized RDD family membrane protein YckC